MRDTRDTDDVNAGLDQDESTARMVEAWLRQGVRALPDGDALPDRVMERVVKEVERAPQRNGWRWLPAWPRASGLLSSSTAAAAGVAILLLSFALYSLLGTDTFKDPASVGDGTSYRVAADGSGDFDTIAEAVAAAQDGDTVLVGRGSYTEAIVIERDITLRGDGSREDVVITAPEDGPRAKLQLDLDLTDTAAYAVLLRDSDARLDSLTFRGENAVVHASGGAPVLSGLGFEDVGGGLENDSTYDFGYLSAVIINGGSVATVESTIIDGPGGIGIWDRSNARIVGNELIGTVVGIRGEPGDEAVIRDNDVRGGHEAGILLRGSTATLIESNTIRDVEGAAIQVGAEVTAWLGVDPVIRDNTISGSGTAIIVGAGARPAIEGNTLTGNTLAIVVTDSDTTISGNELRDNKSGIFVMSGAPTIEGNAIAGGAVGLGLGGERATPILRGNSICDNETNVNLAAGAVMPETTGDRICADAPTLASQ